MIDRRALLGLLAGFATLIPALPVLSRGQQAPAPLPPASGVIDRIAFGSCNDQRRAQGFWDAILAQHPQLLILMGDNVYGDVSSPEMAELREAYARLNLNSGLTNRLLSQWVPPA